MHRNQGFTVTKKALRHKVRHWNRTRTQSVKMMMGSICRQTEVNILMTEHYEIELRKNSTNRRTYQSANAIDQRKHIFGVNIIH